MKTKYRILGLVIAAFLFSCEDTLDISQHGATPIENFYQTDEDASEAIASIYAFLAIPDSYYNYYFVKNLLSDDLWCGGGGRGDNNNNEQLNEYTFGPDLGGLTGTFQLYYKIIYLTNAVLGHVPDESRIQKQVRAEAKVIRAFAYIDLISMWGTPPLVDHELDSSEYRQPNGSREDLWKFVETDLKEAIESGVMHEKANADDDSSYRVTKQFAEALLGKAYVFQEKWADATATLDKMIGENKYRLYDGPYEDILKWYSDNNCESLFEANRINDPNNATTSSFTSMIGWRGNEMTFGQNSTISNECWGYCNPQKSLYDAFVEYEGKDGYRLNNTIKTYEQIVESGDVVTPGHELYGHEGYFMWKHRVVRDEFISGGVRASHNNFHYMRYAEVLLLAAEAHLKNGNASKATEYVNQIRERVHLPSYTSPVTMEKIMIEKRLELWGESVRYQDMIRWGIADQMLKDQGKKTPWFQSDRTVRWVVYNSGDVAGFKEKNWLLPFPETEIALNPNIEQNLGW
jgi:hypothetical protein